MSGDTTSGEHDFVVRELTIDDLPEARALMLRSVVEDFGDEYDPRVHADIDDMIGWYLEPEGPFMLVVADRATGNCSPPAASAGSAEGRTEPAEPRRAVSGRPHRPTGSRLRPSRTPPARHRTYRRRRRPRTRCAGRHLRDDRAAHLSAFTRGNPILALHGRPDHRRRHHRDISRDLPRNPGRRRNRSPLLQVHRIQPVQHLKFSYPPEKVRIQPRRQANT